MTLSTPSAVPQTMAAFNIPAPNSVNPGSPYQILQQIRNAEPIEFSVENKPVSGAGAQSVELFTIIGSVIIFGLGGDFTDVTDTTTVSGCYYDLWDGTLSVPINDSATPTDCSGATLSSKVMTVGDETADLGFNLSDQVRKINLATPYGPAILVTQKQGASTKIRFNFTGDANTDAEMSHSLKFFSVSMGSSIM